MKKLKAFDKSYFRGKNHFEEDGTQNYLVCQPIKRYFKIFSANDNNISTWESKESKVLLKQLTMCLIHT